MPGVGVPSLIDVLGGVLGLIGFIAMGKPTGLGGAIVSLVGGTLGSGGMRGGGRGMLGILSFGTFLLRLTFFTCFFFGLD